MKRILLSPILLISFLVLQGCAGGSNDIEPSGTNAHQSTASTVTPQALSTDTAADDNKDWTTDADTKDPMNGDDTDKDTKDNADAVPDDKDTDNGNSEPVTTASCEAIAEPIEPFIWVQSHYGLLRDQPYVISQADSSGELTLPGETGGLLGLTVTSEAAAGATSIQVDSTVALVPGQLITYLGTNFDYNVAQILSLDDTTINLTDATALVSAVNAGQNLWNFYFDPSHPNEAGYIAMADYGYRSVASSISDGGVHVLLGDSWFDNNVMRDRLAQRFVGSTVIQEGIGGNTLCDLLARFDTDVSPALPDYVWINSSINDYFNDVTQEAYKIRLQNLIFKIQQAGAQAIVFDSAPGPSGTSADGTLLLDLARRYTTQISHLLDESQPL